MREPSLGRSLVIGFRWGIVLTGLIGPGILPGCAIRCIGPMPGWSENTSINKLVFTIYTCII